MSARGQGRRRGRLGATEGTWEQRGDAAAGSPQESVEK